MVHSYTLSEILRCHYRLGELDIQTLSKLALTKQPLDEIVSQVHAGTKKC